MPKFDVTVHVFAKRDVLNPAEPVTKRGLHSLGFASVGEIRMGKCFVVSIDARNRETAEAEVVEMCKRLLAFSVAEEFKIVKIEEIPPTPALVTPTT